MDTVPSATSVRFQSTPSARRATFASADAPVVFWIFQSTPSARRATTARKRDTLEWEISIHALREEGDGQ